jgi:hypothetical protein
MTVGDYFESYEEWHEAITVRCGLRLTADYCRERIDALRDTRDESTRAFITLYGAAYRDRVVSWFERALAAAG